MRNIVTNIDRSIAAAKELEKMIVYMYEKLGIPLMPEQQSDNGKRDAFAVKGLLPQMEMSAKMLSQQIFRVRNMLAHLNNYLTGDDLESKRGRDVPNAAPEQERSVFSPDQTRGIGGSF